MSNLTMVNLHGIVSSLQWAMVEKEARGHKFTAVDGWAKVVTAIDPNCNNGFAFQGSFLPIGKKNGTSLSASNGTVILLRGTPADVALAQNYPNGATYVYVVDGSPNVQWGAALVCGPMDWKADFPGIHANVMDRLAKANNGIPPTFHAPKPTGGFHKQAVRSVTPSAPAGSTAVQQSAQQSAVSGLNVEEALALREKQLQTLAEAITQLSAEKDAVEAKLAAAGGSMTPEQQAGNQLADMLKQLLAFALDNLEPRNTAAANEWEKYMANAAALLRGIRKAKGGDD